MTYYTSGQIEREGNISVDRFLFTATTTQPTEIQHAFVLHQRFLKFIQNLVLGTRGTAVTRTCVVGCWLILCKIKQIFIESKLIIFLIILPVTNINKIRTH